MTPKRRHIDKLVLSVKPLSAAERRNLALESADTEFMDLAALSVGGLGRVRELRRTLDVHEVVVAPGTDKELAVFGDLLSALACFVPAKTRLISRPDGRLAPIEDGLPTLLMRLGVSTARGLWSLAVNSWNSGRGSLSVPRVNVGELPGRFLYLRPTLQFGPQVGGSIGHVAGVANALVRRGHCVKMVAMCQQPLLVSEIEQDVVEPSFPTAFPNELNRHRYHRLFVRKALRSAADFRPSHLYARYSLSDLTGPLLRRKFRIPLILEYNGSEVWTQRHWGEPLLFESASSRIEEANLRAADLVVVVSEEIKRQVIDLGIAEEKVLFYPNCVDPQIFDPEKFNAASRARIREQVGLPRDSFVYTFVGTFGRWHGTDVLAQAIRFLLDAHRAWLEDRKIRFLFVGDGLLAPRVREILCSETRGPFVSLAGYRPQEETPAILAASDILLSPHVPNPDGSPFFGSPTKLFEYMAMAKPIIASDLDQIGQVLRGWSPDHTEPTLEEPAAVLVKPGDIEDLVRGILLTGRMSRRHLEELGCRARSIVLRSFTWDRNVEVVLSRLNHILQRPLAATDRFETESPRA